MFQHKEIVTAGQEDYESKVYLKNMREWLMRKLSHVGPRDHSPSASSSKAVLTFSASCLSNFTTQEFWSASPLRLLKVTPLWSKCERKMWCIYSAHKVAHILPWTGRTRGNFAALCIKHVLLCLNTCACFVCFSVPEHVFFMTQLKYTNTDLPKYTR